MRKKREPESQQQRSDRLEQDARDKQRDRSVESEALDAAVQKSIRLHGA
ncbi:hypothetical protein GCM10022276_20940 [Sphingomonas limnosediminicola]|jgi:hypothetical protein|uniref:Uncharacterized protein n=1 Tax=Sphingomonas limnosediminicola TaxID=940133 RepID=A0ABP7LLR8_9SPHN